MTRNLDQLGMTLRRMYDSAPQGDKTTQIHLFGIKYAADIQAADVTAREIVLAAGMQKSYATEVSKGIRLAKYVNPRPAHQD